MNRRLLLAGSAALLAGTATTLPALATPVAVPAADEAWLVGSGIDAFAEIVDGKVPPANVVFVMMAKYDMNQAERNGDIYRGVAAAYPHEPERLAYSQRWDGLLKQLQDSGTLVNVKTRRYGEPTWCEWQPGMVMSHADGAKAKFSVEARLRRAAVEGGMTL